jgi:hypothetical protein
VRLRGGALLAVGGSGAHIVLGTKFATSGFFFLWTLFALGTTGLFSVIESVRGLVVWSRAARARQ